MGHAPKIRLDPDIASVAAVIGASSAIDAQERVIHDHESVIATSA